jgi:hypothetical protein
MGTGQGSKGPNQRTSQAGGGSSKALFADMGLKKGGQAHYLEEAKRTGGS